MPKINIFLLPPPPSLILLDHIDLNSLGMSVSGVNGLILTYASTSHNNTVVVFDRVDMKWPTNIHIERTHQYKRSYIFRRFYAVSRL